MQNARLDESQAGIKSARRNINNLRYADDTTLMEESKKVHHIHNHKSEGQMYFPGILIPACASSSLAFCMMYSA